MKLRINDNVIVQTGKDKGKTGTIIKILPKKDTVLVEGINKRIKHVKKREGNPGERVEFSAPIHVSNVSIIDPKTNTATRIGYKSEGKTKIRVTKKSGTEVPSSKPSKK